jgi:hypothetical protein
VGGVFENVGFESAVAGKPVKQKWRTRVAAALVLALLAAVAQAQPLATEPPADPEADEKLPFILFDENVQVSEAGGASDVSFVASGFNTVIPANLIWLIRPGQGGIVALASRPIQDTAKAGEEMGAHGKAEARHPTALQVTDTATYVLDASGMLYVFRTGGTDSVRVGSGVVGSSDVAIGLSGLVYVLWGNTVAVFEAGAPKPTWSFEVAPEQRPAVALASSSWGEVIVAGHGTLALAAYELGGSGRFERTRGRTRTELDVGTPGGMCLAPSMILPQKTREAWADEDEFLFVTGPETGTLAALKTRTFEEVARRDVRKEIPFVAPGRIDISNRGQVGFVDARSGVAHVLRVGLMIGMLENSDVSWRILEAKPQTLRIPGGSRPDSTASPSGG